MNSVQCRGLLITIEEQAPITIEDRMLIKVEKQMPRPCRRTWSSRKRNRSQTLKFKGPFFRIDLRHEPRRAANSRLPTTTLWTSQPCRLRRVSAVVAFRFGINISRRPNRTAVSPRTPRSSNPLPKHPKNLQQSNLQKPKTPQQFKNHSNSQQCPKPPKTPKSHG